jgi:hypothetical protein
MNCENYKEMIPEYISGELSKEKIIELEKHIESCLSCSDELNFEISVILNLSDEKIEVPAGLNRSIIEKLPQKSFIYTNRYFIYSAAASVVFMIVLSVFLNLNNGIQTAPVMASKTGTINISVPQNDYASLGYIDEDLEDMIEYDAALYDNEKWSSDSSGIFTSDNEIVNDLITLEELESYDDYLSSL